MKPAFEHGSDMSVRPEDITSIGVIADKNAEVSRAMVSVDKKMIRQLSDTVTSQGRLKLGELIDQIFELGLDLSGQGIQFYSVKHQAYLWVGKNPIKTNKQAATDEIGSETPKN